MKVANRLRALLPRAVSLFEALATPHGVDRYLELVNPMLTVRELRAEVVEVGRHGASVTLTMRPTHRWRGFRAGQFVQLVVVIDGVRHTRCYSPSNSEHRADGHLELTVKAHDGGLVSRHLHRHARPGLVLGLLPATGDFTLPSPRPANVLLVSGGSGITPVLAMLRTLCAEGYPGHIGFVHYNTTESEVGALQELRSLARRHPNVEIALGFSRQPADGGLSGRFCAEHLRTVAPWHADAETYLCGPASLLTAVRGHFTAAGLADRLHWEDFAPTPPAAAAGPATGSVRYRRSSATSVNTGQSLLEQAEAAGLSPQFGCRMGICYSCTTVKASGCTQNLITGERQVEPDTEIQLCVSVPVGDVVLDL